MHNKVILSILLGIIAIRISQVAFAEEIEKMPYIATDEEKFQQPKSKYNYQELAVIGFVENYNRGAEITINITYPDESQEGINTYASKKGEIYTLLYITQDSQMGEHVSEAIVTSYQ